MTLCSVVVILSMLHLPSVDTQEDYWPVHTACNSDKIQVIYRSCGEIKHVYYYLEKACSKYANNIELFDFILVNMLRNDLNGRY